MRRSSNSRSVALLKDIVEMFELTGVCVDTVWSDSIGKEVFEGRMVCGKAKTRFKIDKEDGRWMIAVLSLRKGASG